MTKITGLSVLNVLALQETMPGVTVTATTATFYGTPKQALDMVELTISRLPGRAHPKASLHAVARKLRKQVLNAPQPVPAEMTLAQKVIASVNRTAGKFGGMIHGEDGTSIDVEFPGILQAANFVNTYRLGASAAITGQNRETFTDPVVITFALESYARAIDLF